MVHILILISEGEDDSRVLWIQVLYRILQYRQNVEVGEISSDLALEQNQVEIDLSWASQDLAIVKSDTPVRGWDPYVI